MSSVSTVLVTFGHLTAFESVRRPQIGGIWRANSSNPHPGPTQPHLGVVGHDIDRRISTRARIRARARG